MCLCFCVMYGTILLMSVVIDGQEIVYRDYIDISVAVASPKVRCVFLCV